MTNAEKFWQQIFDTAFRELLRHNLSLVNYCKEEAERHNRWERECAKRAAQHADRALEEFDKVWLRGEVEE